VDTKRFNDYVLIRATVGHGWQRILNKRIILPSLLLLIFLIQFLDLVSLNAKANGANNLTVSIRAESQADYSNDLQSIYVPAISEHILNEIIRDSQGTGSAEERMATMQSSLLSPVPTMTAGSQHNLQPTPTPVSVFPTSVSVSPTVVTVSLTPGVSATAPATAISYATTMPTFIPASTSTPSNPPPASTPVPQKTKKPHPTQKPKPTKRVH